MAAMGMNGHAREDTLLRPVHATTAGPVALLKPRIAYANIRASKKEED